MNRKYMRCSVAATLIGAASMAASPSTIAAPTTPAPVANPQWLADVPMTTPMRRTLAPGTVPEVVDRVVKNPAQIVDNPIASCAACHAGDDLARYAKTVVPMMQFMNPQAWNNPATFNQAMGVMMNPATYAEWFTAMLSKFNQMVSPVQHP